MRSILRVVTVAAATTALLTACNRTEPVPEVPPRQITEESPFHYPEVLWDAGIEGEATLRVFVTAAGAVDTVRLERSSGHAAFDTAAVEGAQRLRFEPARRGDEPVGVWVLLPVQFEMGDAAARAEETP